MTEEREERMEQTARQMKPAPEPAPEALFRIIPITLLKEHPANPRKHFDAAQFQELADSIRAKGVLNPLLVRPEGEAFQILAGARRFRAAKAAGLEAVPVLIRQLEDDAAFELMIIDNLQRDDLHPLEEAAGYQSLTRAGYDVARIAERVGRSVKYIYDRVKLLSLTKEAQKIFLDGTISAGHAILLARLSPADQKRALDVDHRHPGLLTAERFLWDPRRDDEDGEAQRTEEEAVKPVSVREFASWIDENIKFDRDQVDPMLFPETAAVLVEAKDKADKLVPITLEYRAADEIRQASKERIYGERSWRRADGAGKDAKTCERSRIGVVVCGPGRGEAFRVCIDKERCTVHWGKEQQEKKKRQAGTAKGGSSEKERWKIEQQKRQEEHAREEAERRRWERARPAILEAVAAAVKKAPAKATGLLADIVLREAVDRYGRGKEKLAQLVPRGSSAEDLVRHMAFLVLMQESAGWGAPEKFPKRARTFGVDVRKILDEAAPVEKVQTAAEPPAKKKAKAS